MARILINHVKRAVCVVYGVSNADLDVRDRHQRFVEPRQMAMAVAKHLCEQSWAQIGRAFQRDEKSARHAAKTVEQRASASAKDYETYFEIARLARAYAAGEDAAPKFSRSADLGMIEHDEIRAMSNSNPWLIAQKLGLPVAEVSRVLEKVA